MPLHIYIYCNLCNRNALPGQSRIDTRAVRYIFSHGGCSCQKKIHHHRNDRQRSGANVVINRPNPVTINGAEKHMRYFKLFSALLLGLLLLAAAAFAALIFVDPTVFRNQLEAIATAAFGREVRIAGPIRLQRSLRRASSWGRSPSPTRRAPPNRTSPRPRKLRFRWPFCRCCGAISRSWMFDLRG